MLAMLSAHSSWRMSCAGLAPCAPSWRHSGDRCGKGWGAREHGPGLRRGPLMDCSHLLGTLSIVHCIYI